MPQKCWQGRGRGRGEGKGREAVEWIDTGIGIYDVILLTAEKLIKRLALLQAGRKIGNGEGGGYEKGKSVDWAIKKLFKYKTDKPYGRGTVCDCIKTINFTHCLSLCLFFSLSFPLIGKLGLCNIKKFLEAASIAQVLQRVSLCSPSLLLLFPRLCHFMA